MTLYCSYLCIFNNIIGLNTSVDKRNLKSNRSFFWLARTWNINHVIESNFKCLFKVKLS